MDSDEYRFALRSQLDPASVRVAARLATIGGAATERTEGVVIDVFPDQDGEGTFAVWARFDGADAFTLDRRLDDERELFAVIWGEDGWEPPVPPRPRGWFRERLEAAMVEVVAEWIDPLIPSDPAALRWEVATPDGAVEPRPVGPSRG